MITISPTASTLEETLHVVDVVLATVTKRLPAHVSREDLASAGKIALVEALNRFSGPPHEVRAYCFTRVRGAVLDELRRLDPLSRRTRAQVTTIRRAVAALEAKLGRVPNGPEIAEATGYTLEHVRELERIATAAESDNAQSAGEDGDIVHRLADDEAACPARTAEQTDASATIHAALGRLPGNHAFVLRRYHFEDATLDAIAGELGVSKERVRQLRDAAEKKLRTDCVVMGLWEALAATR